MGHSTGFQPGNDNGTNDTGGGGIVVIAQGLTSGPIEISFPELKTVDSLRANVVAQSGAILHEVNANSLQMNFSGLLLPAGENKLVVWAGDCKKEAII